jgi:hypothetical protein
MPEAIASGIFHLRILISTAKPSSYILGCLTAAASMAAPPPAAPEIEIAASTVAEHAAMPLHTCRTLPNPSGPRAANARDPHILH